MKKITITNGYTWYNKGDSGILLGTINAIIQLFGEEVDIEILSFTPEEDKKRYCQIRQVKDVNSNVLNPYPFKKTKSGKLIAIMKLFIKLIWCELGLLFNQRNFVNNNQSLKRVSESDLIIVCGGGFLGGKKFNSLIHLYQIYINTRLSNNVVLWGTSVEPFRNKVVERLTSNVLKRLKVVFPREDITTRLLQEFIPKENLCEIPDLAFMLNEKREEVREITEIKNRGKKVIGITVRKWHFPNSSKPDVSDLNYREAIKAMMEYYIENHDVEFMFIPQVVFEGDDDSIVAKEIKLMLKPENRDSFLVPTNDWSPEEIKTLIGNFDMFVGTRMHSNIFSLSMSTPTVAIAYEKKTDGIMKSAHMSDYVLDIDTITAESLISTMKKCESNSGYIRSKLSSRIREIKLEILEKSNILGELA